VVLAPSNEEQETRNYSQERNPQLLLRFTICSHLILGSSSCLLTGIGLSDGLRYLLTKSKIRSPSSDGWDIVINTSQDMRIGVEITFARGMPGPFATVDWQIRTLFQIGSSRNLDHLIMIHAIEDDNIMNRISRFIKEQSITSVSLIIGYIDESGEFQVYEKIEGAHP